jgi:hypothetical protein
MNLDEAHSKTGTGADVLAMSASMFHPSDELMNGQDKMEVTFRPSIPNNLEQIFNRHDMYKKKKEIIKLGEYIEVNIGSDQDPRMIKIWKRYF